MEKVSIILPCYNSGEHLEFAIMSIIDNTDHPYELLLIESESTDGTDKVCDKMQYYFPDKIKVFHTKKEGITKAINFGIEQAGQNDIYLTQDDVILPKLYGRDWLNELVKLSKLDKCGLVTTIRAGGISGPDYLNNLKWFGTWSLFIPRTTINQIGLFDESFSPGPGDDIDYSYRVFTAGLKVYEANFWVDHHRMTKNFNDNSKLCKRGGQIFRKKYKLDN